MTVNLIPMAGAGVRFAQAGYSLPKPLISVSGQPMILNVVRDLPPAERWVFVVRKEHLSDYHIDRVLISAVPSAEILIDPEPSGQAMTCLQARSSIDPSASLLIASCDNGYLYNAKKYQELKNDSTVDAIVWTFTERETLRRNPTAWGWNELKKDGRTIQQVSIKNPVSNDPFHDHAVVATFWFRRAEDFFMAADRLVLDNSRVKNEFYVDAIPNYLRMMRKRSVIFDVDLYVGWGKPDDLHEYEFMDFTCQHGTEKLNEEQQRLLPLWKEYFLKTRNPRTRR